MSERSRIIDAVGAMPFIGRSLVRVTFLQGRAAAQQGDEALRNKKAGELRTLGLAHAPGAVIGLLFGVAHAINGVKYGGGTIDMVQAAYDTGYATTQGLVTYTQLALARRLRHMPQSDEAGQHAQSSEPVACDVAPTRTEELVTKVSQVLFIGTLATGVEPCARMFNDMF